MADYIFTKTTCAKSAIYGTLKTAMINAGWQNITSLASTDGDVMYSTGEDGDKALYLCLRATNSANANSVETTDYCYMSYRLPEGYTPGAVGVAGTFTRAVGTEVFKNVALAPVSTTVTVAASTTVTLYYHVNKNRIIFSVIYPDASAVSPVVHYMGLCDELYISTTGSRDVIVASSAAMATANSYIYISNSIPSMPSDTTATQRYVYCQLAPKQVNADGNVILSSMMYGNATEGYRGRLTGLYALGTVTPVTTTGNIVTIGAKQYFIINVGTLNYNSFGGSGYLAIQIA